MKKLFVSVLAALALAGCNSDVQKTPEQLAIQSVYSVNARVADNSKTAAEVVSKLQSVRLTGCPAEFVDAYKTYIRAWEKLADVEKKMYSMNMQKAASDMSIFMSTYKSNPNESTVKLKEKWPAVANDLDIANSAISKAFTDFKLIGSRYDAVYE